MQMTNIDQNYFLSSFDNDSIGVSSNNPDPKTTSLPKPWQDWDAFLLNSYRWLNEVANFYGSAGDGV